MVRLSTLNVLCVTFLSAVIAFPQDSSSGVAATPAAKAVVPRLIRFGGVLKDSGAKPLHGAQDVTFSLYAIEAGGEALWFETQTVEADALGRYSVLLGAMHPDGLPMDLFTSGEARWLGVQVGRLSEQPRILLVAVPYALKAADADTLGGKPATAFVASDQLKDQVRDEVKTQVTQSGSATRTLIGTAPAPQAMGEGQSSFLCNLAADCVAVTQSGSGIGLHATTPTGSAVLGELSSTTSGAAVYGRATGATGAASAVQGDSASPNAVGVLGRAFGTTGTAKGVFGRSFSTSGTGVHGDATATTGATRGVWGSTVSTGGVGVWGQSAATSGFTTGVSGTVASTAGVGVYGQAGATSGATIGVKGTVESIVGVGVLGQANHVSGPTYGVLGTVASGSGVGVLGTDNPAASGATIGVLAKVNSGSGTALVAESAGWRIFTGRNGTVEKIYIDANGNVVTGGNVTASGTFTGSGSGLTNVNAATLGGFLAAAFAPATGSSVYVAKAGDTMAGTLNLPADGLVAGTNQLVLASGNAGIGIATPSQKLEVNGGVRLNTVTLKPTCDATTRGTFWVTLGGAGVEDLVQACTKDAADAYGWRNVI